MTTNTRAIAQKNEARILKALHRFGWLRTRDIACMVWSKWPKAHCETGPTYAPPNVTESSIRMAQRTLKRMLASRLVALSKAPDGSTIYALAEQGARELRDGGLDSCSGTDLIRSFSSQHFRHRCIANEVAISAIAEGYSVSTEREISTGKWLGGEKGILGKKPDVCIRKGKSIFWVEVERSRKNATEYEKLLKWVSALLEHSAPNKAPLIANSNDKLEKLVFICTETFKKRLFQHLLENKFDANTINGRILFISSLYKFRDINFEV